MIQYESCPETENFMISNRKNCSPLSNVRGGSFSACPRKPKWRWRTVRSTRYVREQGWNLYDYYCDDGVSGTTFDRPSFNRLVQDATDGKIKLILTKDLSRPGRDYIEAGRYTEVFFS